MKRIIGIILLLASSSFAVDLGLDTEQYSTGGLFTDPLFPAENSSVKITVRASVEGEINTDVKANIGITAPNGKVVTESVVLKLDKGGKTATGSIDFKTPGNGQYFVTATIDPNNEIAESNEKNNTGRIELPVVIDGRQPHFPWYTSAKYFRWITIIMTAGEDDVEPYLERGVKVLLFKKGTNLEGKWDAKKVSKYLKKDVDKYPGVYVDECGGYPTPENLAKFEKFCKGGVLPENCTS